MNLDHTDTILTEYARLLGPTLDQFILNRVFPAVDVPSDTGDFFDVTGGFAAASLATGRSWSTARSGLTRSRSSSTRPVAGLRR